MEVINVNRRGQLCLSVLQRQGSKHNSFLFQREETNAFKDLGTGNRIATWLFYVSAKKYDFPTLYLFS